MAIGPSSGVITSMFCSRIVVKAQKNTNKTNKRVPSKFFPPPHRISIFHVDIAPVGPAAADPGLLSGGPGGGTPLKAMTSKNVAYGVL